MALFVVLAVGLGVWAALLLVGYAMVRIECPFDRVAFYLTFLATDVMSLILAYFLLSHTTLMVLFSFLLTKCLVWCIMDHSKMVHHQAQL